MRDSNRDNSRTEPREHQETEGNMRNTAETTAGNSKRTLGNGRDNSRDNIRTEPREHQET